MMRRFRGWVLAGVVVAVLLGGALPAMAAYHHQGEIDSAVFLTVYPKAAGTKLDSCSLCHTGGSTVQGGKTVSLGSCQWCHLKYGYAGTGDLRATLNSYGKDYYDIIWPGRNTASVRYIAGRDSDGDGYTNSEEIAALRYPGDTNDDPKKVAAPSMVYDLDDLEDMPEHTQFMLLNATKSDDAYTEYSGVTVEGLLASAGVLPSATGIKAYAPDGFSTYHPLEASAAPVPGMYPVRWTYPAQTFWFDTLASLQDFPLSGWVNYSSPQVAGRTSGEAIVVPGGLKLLLAYQRDGSSLTTGVLDISNKLNGEGPYRVVPPQLVPSVPDQRSTNSTDTSPWPFDANADHNAGYASRSTTIIKVEPLPEGTTDIDVMEAGWDYVDSGKIVVYGAINPLPTAHKRVLAIKSQIRGLSKASFVGGGDTRARMLRMLAKVDTMILSGDADAATAYMNKFVKPRVDGRRSLGKVRRADWIKPAAARKRAYLGVLEVNTLLKATP